MKLFIATPSYDGKLVSGYIFGLMQSAMLSAEAQMPFQFSLLTGESLVTRARNRLVNQFLKSDCDAMLFIDADLHFRGEDVIRIAKHDVPLVAGFYPFKRMGLQGVRRHVGNLKFPLEKRGELYLCTDAPTGFMRIRRDVFERMAAADLAPEYICDAPAEPEGKMRAYFDCAIRDNRYLSEDYEFCRRWQMAGGEVWCDPHCVLKHEGLHTYILPPIAEDIARLDTTGAT